MKIIVKAKPNSKTESVEKIGDNYFSVCVKEPPIGGRANEAVVKALAKHFRVPVSSLRITVGHTSRNKIIEIK